MSRGHTGANRVAGSRVAAREGRTLARAWKVAGAAGADAPRPHRDGLCQPSPVCAGPGHLRRPAVRAGRLDEQRIRSDGPGRARHVSVSSPDEPGAVPLADAGSTEEDVHASRVRRARRELDDGVGGWARAQSPAADRRGREGMNTTLAIYLAGVAVGLWRTDAPLPTRVLLAVLWPIGPLAFVIVVAILLAASPLAFIGPKPR